MRSQNEDASKPKRIYEELCRIYSAKEKEIEDVVQTLLKKEARTEVSQSNSNTS